MECQSLMSKKVVTFSCSLFSVCSVCRGLVLLKHAQHADDVTMGATLPQFVFFLR